MDRIRQLTFTPFHPHNAPLIGLIHLSTTRAPLKPSGSKPAQSQHHCLSYCMLSLSGGYRIHIQDPEHLKDMLITNYTKFFKPTFLAKILDFKIAGKNLFTVNFKEHSQQRKLLNPSFSHGSVQTYLPIFRRITDNLCQVGMHAFSLLFSCVNQELSASCIPAK